MDNKDRIKMGAKVAALAIWALITIITCAGVWNYCPEAFVKICAVVLFCINGYELYRFGKTIKPEEIDDDKKEQ